MPMLKPPPMPPLSLDRIKALHAEIESHIDSIVAREAKTCPGVPAVRIKYDLMTRAGGCSCRAFALNQGAA